MITRSSEQYENIGKTNGSRSYNNTNEFLVIEEFQGGFVVFDDIFSCNPEAIDPFQKEMP